MNPRILIPILETIEALKIYYIARATPWKLDVVFREDLQRTKTGNAPENLAIIRKLSLQLLNKIPDNESIKNRKKIAGWNDKYLIDYFLIFKCV